MTFILGGTPFQGGASLFTPAEVDLLLFGDGSSGNVIPVDTSGFLYANWQLGTVTPATNFNMAGFRLRALDLTIPTGITLDANGSIFGNNLGAVDYATGNPAAFGQGGLWTGGNGANWDGAATFTDAQDVRAAGGGDGGSVVNVGPNSNRGGSVNSGAIISANLTPQSFDLTIIGGGAGGAAWFPTAPDPAYFGGGGGGVCVVLARRITVNGTGRIRANGGPGNSGATVRPCCGGGGGVVVVIAREFLPSQAYVRSRLFALGGAGSNGGEAGRPGRILCLTVGQLGLP